MFIDYDENELNRLFNGKPLFIDTEETGMFIYSFNDNNGMKITLNISIYEKAVILILSRNEKIVLENTIKNIGKLSLENECLRIHQINVAQDIVIQFTPSILVKYVNN